MSFESRLRRLEELIQPSGTPGEWLTDEQLLSFADAWASWAGVKVPDSPLSDEDRRGLAFFWDRTCGRADFRIAGFSTRMLQRAFRATCRNAGLTLLDDYEHVSGAPEDEEFDEPYSPEAGMRFREQIAKREKLTQRWATN